MRTVGLAPNPHKKGAVRLALELAEWLTASGIRALICSVADAASCKAESVCDDDIADSELVVVLGGDGTMLRWSRLAAPKGTPMLGVNFGRYGFITEVRPKDAQAAIARFLDGDYFLSERVVLRATVTHRNKKTDTYYALNDVVVSKGPLARMMGLHLSVNDKFIVTYSADGIIVASPTGSTAYSLSAGGPVVHPGINVLIVTPICPHTLNARSLVVPDSELVQILGECGEEAAPITLTVDGQLSEGLNCREKVEVGKADFTAKLVQMEPQSFYHKLQNRLRWGERFS